MANTTKRARKDESNGPSVFFIIAILIAFTIFVIAFLKSIPDKAKEPEEGEQKQSRIHRLYEEERPSLVRLGRETIGREVVVGLDDSAIASLYSPAAEPQPCGCLHADGDRANECRSSRA